MIFFTFRKFLKHSSRLLSKPDLYAILGVTSTASDNEIKQAYFTLAKQFHPDINKSPQSDTKFAQINEAYETLLDKTKRQQYDQSETFSSTNPKGFKGFSDIFQEFSSPSVKGEDACVNLELDFLEAVKGTLKKVEYEKKNICVACGGYKGKTVQCGKCSGTGFVSTGNSSILCNACEGFGEILRHSCGLCVGTGFTLTQATESVAVPAGIGMGQVLRVSGKGHAGLTSFGDLLITVVIKPHKVFKRENQNVLSTFSLSLAQAVLGDVVQVETVHGMVDVKVQTGTNSNDIQKIVSYGIPFLPPNDTKKGDHIVTFKIKPPKTLSSKEKTLFKELAKEEGELTSDTPPLRFKTNIK